MGFPGAQRLGGLAENAPAFGLDEGRNESRNDSLGDLVLHIEGIRELAVVSLRPDLERCPRIDEPARDTDPAVAVPGTSFQYVAHIELAADFTDVDGRVLEGEARVAGDYEQPAQTRQLGQHVFGDNVAEEVLRRIAGQICEREDGDGRQIARHPVADPGRHLFFVDVTHEAEADPRHCLDQPLRLPAVADDLACDVQPGGQSRVGNCTPVPDGGDQLVLRDGAGSVAEEITEQVKHLGRRRHDQAVPTQLMPVGIQDTVFKAIAHGDLANRSLRQRYHAQM